MKRNGQQSVRNKAIAAVAAAALMGGAGLALAAPAQALGQIHYTGYSMQSCNAQVMGGYWAKKREGYRDAKMHWCTRASNGIWHGDVTYMVKSS